jgi:hypothetical protein
MDDGPSDTAMRVAELCDDGRITSLTAERLMRLADMFDDYGDALVTVTPRSAHLTWSVAGVSLTVSVSDGEFWGVSLIDDGLPPFCHVGDWGDEDSLADLGALCMASKARIAAALVDMAERTSFTGNKKRRRP